MSYVLSGTAFDFLSGGAGSGGALNGYRQNDSEEGALARRAFDFNTAPIGSNKSLDRRQSQAAAGRFGGEERIEDLLLNFLVHTAPGIADFQRDVLARRNRGLKPIASGRLFIELDRFGADAHGAAGFSDRFHRIHDQIGDDLAHLFLIRGESGKI